MGRSPVRPPKHCCIHARVPAAEVVALVGAHGECEQPRRHSWGGLSVSVARRKVFSPRCCASALQLTHTYTHTPCARASPWEVDSPQPRLQQSQVHACVSGLVRTMHSPRGQASPIRRVPPTHPACQQALQARCLDLCKGGAACACGGACRARQVTQKTKVERCLRAWAGGREHVRRWPISIRCPHSLNECLACHSDVGQAMASGLIPQKEQHDRWSIGFCLSTCAKGTHHPSH